ncbi:MAG: lysophospholipid acyltransferase family protein [Verrucomicrobiae bacterium]|nr:lysophospholipid acyltransferase family protein [Verrucomicrobiae bacterium]
MAKLLKSLRYRLEWAVVATMAALIPLLPRRAAHALGQGLGAIAYLADSRGRGTAIENLRCVYGDTLDERQRRRIAREAFQSFARTVIDQFWSRRLNRENYLDYCELEMDDPEAIERARDTGAIWVTPHYSNFEWIALMMGFRGYRFTIIAQDFKNPLLTDIFTRNRQVSGHQVIPQQRALFRLLKNLMGGGHAAFLTDLNIKPGRAATIIRCLGFDTCVTALHAELMRRTELPVIPGICVPLPGGRYRMRGLKPLTITADMTDRQIAQACWDAFEPFLREHPAPWLWMYKHWRYLPEHPDRPYPAYASRSGKFDRLAKEIAAAETSPEAQS